MKCFTTVVYADPSFSRIFTVELLYGSLSLDDKNQILISDDLAKTFYGRTDVGWVNHSHKWSSGKTREYVVGGVFKKFPGNSSFRFPFVD